MRIALIEAGLPGKGPAGSPWAAPDGRLAAPSAGLLSLAVLAALARPGDEVRIIDEKASGGAEEVQADLAGITFKTMNAGRAYALADGLRTRGTRVVLCGPHAGLCPEESAAHADAVAVGEGEVLWQQILADAEGGALQPIYGAPSRPAPADGLPPARVELIDHPRYLYHAAQSARGFPLDGELCAPRAFFGAGFRPRSVETVAGELERLLGIERKPVLFVDDVFGAGHPEFIARLTDRLRALGLEYGATCDLAMLTPEMVDRLAASGCRVMGLNLPGTCSPEEAAAIGAIQAQGIDIWGCFALGFEFQKADVFGKIVDFVHNCRIKYVSLTLLAPGPGTPMARRLGAEGRMLSCDWSLYDQAHAVFRPANMTPEELEGGFARVLREIGDRCPVERIAESFRNGRPAPPAAPAFLARTGDLVGGEALARLARSTVAIAGLGGVGGAVLTTLARMGVGCFRIADPGGFDEADLNSQLAATRATLGRNKAEVYAELLLSINPAVKVEIFSEGITEENVVSFLEGADLLIDALDLKVATPLRLKLAARARVQGIFEVISPIIAFGAAVAIAAPNGIPIDPVVDLIARARGEGRLPRRLAEFFSPVHLGIMQAHMARGQVPSIAPAPMLAAALVATEAAMILGGEAIPGWRKPACLPEILLVDLAMRCHRVALIQDLA